MEGSGKEKEAPPSSLYEPNSDGSHDHVQRELSSSSRCELPEQECLKENWGSYGRLVDKHRTRMKEALPSLTGKSEESSLEETQSESETERLWEDTIQDEVAFQKKLHEAELAIGSAEMFLPSFKETLTRISKACYVSAADMIKISMQEDLLVMELGALKNMKGLLQQLLRSSKEKEIISTQIEDLIWKLTESETEAVELKHEVLRKERYILELSTQLQHEKANVLKASRHSESTQLVQTHLQCQIERKEAENNQLRTKFKTVEKNITEWKQQVGEYKQQILAEKDRRKERRNALKRAASVQKQRAELLKAAVESLISKIREKEIQLSEVLSACNVWKSHHKAVVDEKTRLEVQAETLKKQIADRLMELRRLQDVGRRSTNEILGKLNAITSENEKISLENTKLKASFASLEASIVSAEAELVDLREEAQQQENIIEHYKNEVVENDSFLKQLALEEENRNVQLKYEDVKRKLEEMELKNKELENQLASQEDCLQKTELQFKQKLASYDALTRQLEAALEDGRKKLKEEVEKIASKEQAFQMKILDLENQLRRKKEEQRHLSRRLDAREKHRQMSLKELNTAFKDQKTRTRVSRIM
uniref:protein BCAP isoform X4 n=1 Tax=Podarcis muralis TaxID=64176 RepID=UPI0010A0A3BF|nr:protein BCAP isoform X4 [Podarcis muralis]